VPGRPRLLAPALAGLAWAGPAHAHALSNRFGDFYGGMLHPLTALEHALPIVALGLLAGQEGARAARWLLLAFPLALLVGAGLASVLPPMPWIRPFNHLSFVVLGLLLAAAWRMPLVLLVGLGALFGLTHGYDNGLAASPGSPSYLYALGVAVLGAVALALVSATALALSATADWPRIAVRIAGSWIAAIGIMMIGLASRPGPS
jgi:urease accessory protein